MLLDKQSELKSDLLFTVHRMVKERIVFTAWWRWRNVKSTTSSFYQGSHETTTGANKNGRGAQGLCIFKKKNAVLGLGQEVRVSVNPGLYK